jgi:AcrR family transcriptional regulator
MKTKTLRSSLSDKRNARERERRRSNRESILHAAETVVCRKGLSAASMDDVADEAGFSKATLYRYVRGKAELVFELLIHFMEDMDSRLKQVLSETADPRAKLLALIREVIRFQEEKENLSRIFVQDRSILRVIRVFVAEQGKSGTEAERAYIRRLRAARRAVFARAETLFGEGIASGVFRPMSVDKAVFHLGAVIQGYSHEKFWRESKPDFENDVLDIHAFFLQGIVPRKRADA